MYSSLYGFYEVNGKIYYDKDLALCSNKNISEVKFNFHDDVFSAQDWTKRPNDSLAGLYKERAQQIRDQYDYVIVNFSGGMDSWNVLNSFLSNGIKVDEIFTRWPLAERKFRKASRDIGEWNIGSEFEYAVLPVLKHIEKNYPGINIFVDDYSECFQQEYNEKLMSQGNHYKKMGSPFLASRTSPYCKNAEKENKSIANVYAYEKIRCEVKDGNFYACFKDGISNDPNNMELFYYSKDLPRLPILQAHCIKDYLKENGIDVNKQYRSIYTKVCYPQYDEETFQTNKLLGTYISGSDSWVKSYSPRYFDSWMWHIKELTRSIDDKFIATSRGIKVGLKSMYTQQYLIETNCGLPDVSWGDDMTTAAIN